MGLCSGKLKRESPKDSRAPCFHEALGITFFVLLLLIGSGLIFWQYDVEFAIPISRLVSARCMVLHAEEEKGYTLGFSQEPLYRAKLQVYLLDSKLPDCCCNTTEGVARCAEWAGVAYDTLTGKYTPREKLAFIEKWGRPGSFYPCWHSRDKDTITFERELNTPFLMLPILCVVVGAWGFYQGANKVVRWLLGIRRRRQGYRKALTDEERGPPMPVKDGNVSEKGTRPRSKGESQRSGKMKDRNSSRSVDPDQSYI